MTMVVGYDLSKLHGDVLSMVVSATFKSEMRFGRWLFEYLAGEESRRATDNPSARQPWVIHLELLDAMELRNAYQECVACIFALEKRQAELGPADLDTWEALSGGAEMFHELCVAIVAELGARSKQAPSTSVN
jgi:hypothetical protein